MADNGSDFFKGFLFGGTIGAIVALLYAPKAGKETREDLKRRSQELLDEAGTAVGNVREHADHIIAEARKEAEKLRDEAERKIAEAKMKAHELLETSKSTITHVADEAVGKAHAVADKGKEKFQKETGRVKDAVAKGVQAYKDEVTETNAKEKKK